MYLPINNFPMCAYRINMKEIIEKSLTVKKIKSMISLFWEISAGSYPLLIMFMSAYSSFSLELSWTFRVVPGIGDLACLVAGTIL